MPPARYSGRRASDFYAELFSTLRAIPGVTAVGATNSLPLGSSAMGFIAVEGQADVGAGAGYRVVSDDYFRAMRIPLLRGRFFGPADDSGTTRVTLVNRAMAERFWPGQDPIGKRFKAKSMEWKDTPWLTVVGVVGNVRHWGLEQDVAGRALRPVPAAARVRAGPWPSSFAAGRRGDGHECGARADSRHRPRRPGRPRDAYGARRSVAGRAALRHERADRVRCAGAHARRDRRVRRAVVLGGAADARDRRAHGVRRASRRRARARGRSRPAGERHVGGGRVSSPRAR